MVRCSYILVVLVCLATPVTAWGQSATLQEALTLEDEGQLVQALDAFRRCLRAEGNSREDLSTIYLHLAMLRLASGEREGARDAMYRLLAVEPDPELPLSAPPAVSELLEEARRLWSGRRLRAEAVADEEVPRGEDAAVRVVVSDDVPGMVAGAALVSGGAVVARAEGSSPFDLAVPEASLASGRTVDLEVQLLDEHGGTLWQGAAFSVVQVGDDGGRREPDEPTTPSREVPEGRGPLWATGWALLATGLVLGGAGAALVAVDGNATGEQRTVEAGIEEEFLNTDLSGWLLVGFGGAALIAGIVLLVLSPRRSDDEARAVRLARMLGGVIEF